MRPPERTEPGHPLHDLGARALGLVLAGLLVLCGLGCFGLAAYHGLARWMAPELAAGVMGLALVLLAALAWIVTRPRRGKPTSVEAPLPSDSDPAAAAGEALAQLLRRAGVGGSKLSVVSLVAGLVAGARRRDPGAAPDVPARRTARS